MERFDHATDFGRRPILSRLAFGATLSLAIGGGYLGLFAISVLAPFIIHDLELSRTAYGLLPTVLFVLAAGSAAVIGRIGERWDSRRALVILFTTAGLSWVGMALAPNYALFVLAVGLAALPLSVCIPATTHLVATYIPRGKQGIFIGVAHTGEQVGAFVVGLSFPTLAVLVGWRGPLLLSVVVAGLGLVGALALPNARRMPSGDAESTNQVGGSSREPYRVLPYLCISSFLMVGAAVVAISYLPLYAFEALRLSPAVAGIVTSVAALSAISARLAWSRLVETVQRPLSILVVIAALSTISMFAIAFTPAVGHWALWVGVAGYGGTSLAWLAPAMTVVSRQVNPATAATVSGLVMFSGFFAAAVMPFAFGTALDRIAGYGAAWLGIAIVHLIATAVILAGSRQQQSRIRERL